MKNRFFTLFLALVASCACMYAETYSGTCGEQGDNLTWNLDTETGVLTISGTGRYNTFVYLYQNPWDPYRSDIKKIVINEGLTYTGNYMFKECTNLISVTLPESLTELGYSMFDECKNLTDISIPNTVTKIGYRAFGHCEKLSTIHIPESVTSIATEAFSGCHSLSKITVAEENPVYDSRDNCNAIIETATNSLLVGCKNTSIPNSVTSVGKYAFLRNDSITSITIPQTVKSIEYGAFSICGNLQSVTLSSGLQTIGENAFGLCRNLQAINIPNTVTSIESNAFSGCSSLTSVTIPNSVTSIGRDAFENSGLISIVLKDSITSIGDRAFNNCENLAFVMCYALEPPTLGESVFRDDYMYSHFDNNNTILYVPAESIDLYKAADQWKDFTNILPLGNQNGQCVVASGTCGKNGDNLTWELSCDGVLTISGTGEMEDYTESATPAPWKSNNTTILSIVIEDGVSNIGNYAFHYCRKLTSVSIPTSITSIGNQAFKGCGNLSSVEIPNSVTNIGWGAFYDCDKLPSITIPNSVTFIDDLAFYFCESLTSIEVAIDNPNYCSEDGVLFNKDKTTLIQYPANNSRTEYVIPNTVTYIAKEAFCRSNYLTSITIPNSVISLDEGAFNDCKFTSINLPTSLISIGRFAFNGCHVSTITIPCNVTSIGEYAFQGPGVSSITCEAIVPPSITGNAFETINRAIPLYVPEESISSYKTAKGWSEFTNIRAIPCIYASGYCGAEGDSTSSHWELSCDSVLTISGTGKIGYISIPKAMIKKIIYGDGITNSGKFNKCNSLSSVALSNSITDIDDYAFKDCRNLTEISIPQNVTSIGIDAFRYCEGLLSITCKSNIPPMLGSSVFDKVDKSIPLYVPAESIGLYETSDQWMEFLNILPIEETPTQCLLASGICGAQGENIIWELGCDSVLTISGTGNMADYSYYFSDYAPWNNYKNMIQSIIIQGDITKIGRHTFISCGQLKSITLPNSITSIGSSAFDGCSNLVSIDIPANITSIEESTFNNCKNLTSAVIPDNVKYIRMSAFWQCSSMISLTIGNSVTSIGNYAFFGCSGLTEITCKAVTPPTLENGVFQSVNKSIPLYVPAQSVELYKAADVWKEFNIQPIPGTEPEPPTPCLIASGYCGAEGDSTNLHWELSCDSVLTISGTGAMADYEYGTSPWYSYHSHIAHITLSDGISTIGSYAFNQCWYLQSAVIPNSVITIGQEAFWHCERMKTLTLSENLVSIGDQAFDFCTNLTAVEFPATLKRMNSKAFANCWKLSTVAIPASVTYIGTDAFAECEELLSINVDENNPNYCSVDDALLNKNATTFIQCPGGLSEYTIPTTVTSIDYMAFAGCKKLSTIFIPENVISIAAQAFINCYQLQSINIPAGITTIQASTFANCFALESIVIPSSVISIEGNAFIGNIGLTSITCEASEPPALGVGVFAEASEMYDEAVNKSTCILYVPYKSIAAYQAADQWNEFTNILPIPGTEPIYHELVLEVNDDLMGHAYGAGQYMDSTWITIEAIANETYRFVGWYNRYSPDDEILYSYQSSEPILMDGDFTLKAVFEPIPMSSDLAMIYVQGQPVDHFISDNYNYTFRYPAHTPESTLPTSNDITFDKGDEYQTVAVAQSGSTIVINVTSGRGMTKTYVLNFVVEVPNQFTVNASSCNDAWGHVEGSGTYDEYSEVSIMAIPNDGYQFYNWNNSILDNPHSLVLKQDTSFIANFLPDETDEIVTAIGSNTILFEWERKPYALGYWLYVYLDISHTVWLCRVKFAGIWPIIIPVDFEWGPGFEPSYIAKVGEESEEVRRMLRAKKTTDDNKISYTLENLAAETEHFFVIEAFDKAEKTVNVQAGTCTTKAKVPTDVENVETDSHPAKFLHNDHIYILRGEHIYDIQGKMVK